MSKLEKILFQLFVFIIPSNLFLKWILPESYVSGYLVDYLIPKLYLSDIPILIILTIWFLRLLYQKKKSSFALSSSILLFIGVIFLIYIRGLLSQAPLASTWYFLKILELGLFFSWMSVSLSFSAFKKLSYYPLLFSILFQSSLGIYQFIAQKSLAGYWLLGETTLSLSSQIDKLSILGRLLIPAYGTTPHSNILGGFLALGLLLLMYLYKKSNFKNVVISVGMICLLFTFSITSWVGFVLGLMIYKVNFSRPSLLWMTAFSLLSPILLMFLSSFFNSTSISRRIELLKVSWKMIGENLLLGTGINNFTSSMSNYGTVISNTRFLQPVHNTFYLFASETGLIGMLALVLISFKLFKNKTAHFGLLIVLIWIGTFDHYLLTLQTGQLLLILLLFLTIDLNSSLRLES